MAAVVQPHRLPPVASPRPDLRVLAGGRAVRPAPAPVAVTPAAVAAVLVALVLVVVGVLALGRGAFADLAPAPAAPSAAAASAGARTVTVRSGDTLWAIARRLQPTGDVRPLVDRLVAANGSPIVVPGSELVIPS